MTTIFIVGGTSWIISFSLQLLMPVHINVQQDRTMFQYMRIRVSTSQFMVEL